MTTLREALQADIATTEASLERKQARLVALEGTFGAMLGHDVEIVRGFFRDVGAHIFVKTTAPAAPVPTLTASHTRIDPVA